MRPLRVAIALPGLHRVNRGAETAFENLGAHWAAMDCDVTLFGSGPIRPDAPYHYRQIRCKPREKFENWPIIPGIRSHYAWEELSFSRTLLRQFQPRDFDITVGCSYPFTNWILRRKTPTGGPKHVFVTQNGDWMLQAHDAEYRFFGCDGLVCTNPQFFARHRGRFPSVLIPNGVDCARFSPGEGDRSAFGLPNGPIALMVSALIGSKRIPEAIQAVAKVPGLFLVVAGDGEMRSAVDAEAARLLPGRFKRLTVPREQMPRLYRSADLFLHTSREEPSANAYLEALASGLPIVAHDWEVTRWTLGDCATLVDCSDESQVVAGLEHVLRSGKSNQTTPGRTLAQTRYDWSLIARHYVDFFRELVAPMPVISAPPRRGALADVGVVAIGRNEGERLQRCLQSLQGKVAAIVYVDSGSSDGSPRAAQAMGAQVVYLDSRQPFTAARARNAGLDRLLQTAPQVQYVQFVDGDCELRDGWLETARAYLQSRDDLAAVCGRRRELHASHSLYNRIIDIEWNTPIGPAKSCGGDSMMKIAPIRAVGSFNASVMAGEEPELCLRLRNAGYKIWRIDAEMTTHDSAIRRFKQLWWRQVRSGYGAMDVYTRFGQSDGLFRSQVRSAQFWTLIVPAMILPCFIIGAIFGIITDNNWLATAGFFALLPIAMWFGQILKMATQSLRRRRPPGLSFAWGWFTMVGKIAAIYGQYRWRKNFLAGQKPVLIEYKRPALSVSVASKEAKA
jgi:glycosyltransferase involved in cell wall biosynthesis